MIAMTADTPAAETERRTMRLRPGRPEDAEACTRVFWDSFATLAEAHSFPIEPGTPEFAAMVTGRQLSLPGFHCVVAENDGGVVGCAFMDERAAVRGIGPVCVAPEAQDAGVGRALMEALHRRCEEQGVGDIRLVQTAYHYRSLALYAKLGYQVREPLSVVAGEPPVVTVPGRSVRPAATEELDACNALCHEVHGFARAGELAGAVAMGMAAVVEGGGEITGYATGFGYGFHAVGRSNQDIEALIGSCSAILGLGILVPSRNGELLGWCLDHGLRIVQQSTLMTLGAYPEPAGAWLPSVVY